MGSQRADAVGLAGQLPGVHRRAEPARPPHGPRSPARRPVRRAFPRGVAAMPPAHCVPCRSLSHGYQTPTKKISAVSTYFESMPYRLDEVHCARVSGRATSLPGLSSRYVGPRRALGSLTTTPSSARRTCSGPSSSWRAPARTRGTTTTPACARWPTSTTPTSWPTWHTFRAWWPAVWCRPPLSTPTLSPRPRTSRCAGRAAP